MSTSRELSDNADAVRARKRLEIGLSSQRPTAKPVVQRPPAGRQVNGMRWLIPLAFAALMAATLLLTLARLFNSPTAWPHVRGNVGSWIGREQTMPTDSPERYEQSKQDVELGLHLYVSDDFDRPGLALAESAEEGRWRLGFVHEEGVYRIWAWQGYAAWAPLDVLSLGTYRAETSLVIAANNPTGYGGLLGRYRNDDAFYLFVVDGQGRIQVMMQQDGVWTVLQPWLAVGALNLAGTPNKLILDDDGQTLYFWGNDVLLFTVPEPVLALGNAGLAGGSQDDEIAQIDFEWLNIYSYR